MNPKYPVELLAPAGGPAQLRAALRAGADAVYFGAGRLNMRARARNFAPEELREVADRCHQAGAKAYLALNTLVYESELMEMERMLSAAREAGVDAVIAADLAVIRAAAALNMPVHASTQMSVSNSAALRQLMDLGIRRVVLARECGLEDIRLMRENLGSAAGEMEFEVFAHGAMCVAVSGRCFLSGFESGRSASRGDCAQPCRRDYEIRSERGGEGFTVSGSHLLSPKDLCTLPFLEQLLDAGIHCLKIEGRNRSPDYVHTVVEVYRRAVDFYAEHAGERDFPAGFDNLKREGMRALGKVYNRGFSAGFYMGKPAGDWSTEAGNQSTHRREYIGRILSVGPEPERVDVRLESAGLREGEPVFAEGPETGFLPLTVLDLRREGLPVELGEKGQVVSMSGHPDLKKTDLLYKWTPRTDDEK